MGVTVKHLLNPGKDEVLDLILKAVEDLIEFELAVILKLDDDVLTVQKSSGPLANSRLENFRIDLRQRRDISRIISEDEPYLFDESKNHQDTYEEILDLPDGHSCLVAPLYVSGSPIGLLTLDHRVCGKFTPGIVRFIGTLSQLIAYIIAQNDSSLYLDAQRQDLTLERNLLLRSSSVEFRKIIGRSRAWEIVLEQIKTVASSDLPVLIQGETGTGKEQVARTIHDLSSRRDEPFITLNCSALNASLAESELFGHEKGAFTSAVARRKGRFEMADGGTLFLDEIADLPAEIQPKILRTLQEGTFERVGGEATLRCNVRIIAASNKDLRKEVQEDNFREDLYYRLGVFPIFLPPLRERDEDVVLLAEHFLKAAGGTEGFYNSSIQALLDYSWPGNVRELQNVIQRALLIARGEPIQPEHLLLENRSADWKGKEVQGNGSYHPVGDGEFPTLQEMEKKHIQRALDVSRGKIYGPGGAAELLGMKPTTLQSRMKKQGLR